MAIVQQKTGAINDGVTFDAPVSANNSIVVLMAYRTDDVTLTVTDTVNGATYSNALGHFFHGNGAVQISYKASSAAGTPTVTANPPSAPGGTMTLFELSGMDTGAGFVSGSAEGAVTDTSAPITPGLSITPADAATMLFVVAGDMDNDARVCTGGAGDITNGVATGTAGCNYGYATLASGGAKTAGLTMDAGDTFAMMACAFKIAGGTNGNASGGTVTSTGSTVSGSASGTANKAGVTVTATASLIAGTAAAVVNGSANGAQVIATATILSGTASAVVNATATAKVNRAISWTASGDGSGYAVGIDTVSRAGPTATAASYASVFDASTATSYTFSNLVAGTGYYVGVSSYGTYGDTSLYSIVDAGDEFSFTASISASASIISGTASASGATVTGPTITASAQLVAGSAAGGISTAGQTITASGSIVAGAATGTASKAGQTVTATSSILPGFASAGNVGQAYGEIITATASIIGATATSISTVSGATITAVCGIVQRSSYGGSANDSRKRIRAIRCG